MKSLRPSKFLNLLFTASCIVLIPSTIFAVTASELIVVVNERMTKSTEIAEYYMGRRGIPKEHLLVTSLTLNEVMERAEFEKKLRDSLRKKIEALLPSTKISGVVLIYGVPLKVLPPSIDWDAQETLHELKKEREQLQQHEKNDEPRIQSLAHLIKELSGSNKRASVDSELMLVNVESYPLEGWIQNPYYLPFQAKNKPSFALKKDDVILVSRLDGPDEQTVYRLIDDAIEVEKTGLQGTAYFDARWPKPQSSNIEGYERWDLSLHKAAEKVKTRMEVQLDDADTLFAPGSAPNAALYSGWYSLARYVDSFTWVRGAVGYHIASSECATLRKQESQVWCLQMLKHGVAATLGPVYEPYVQGFPPPEIFFAALTEGHMNLGESYLVSLPFISWQMVLVGDPLYKPFQPRKRE